MQQLRHLSCSHRNKAFMGSCWLYRNLGGCFSPAPPHHVTLEIVEGEGNVLVSSPLKAVFNSWQNKTQQVSVLFYEQKFGLGRFPQSQSLAALACGSTCARRQMKRRPPPTYIMSIANETEVLPGWRKSYKLTRNTSIGISDGYTWTL